MILHSDPLLSIYFGDARTSLQREACTRDCSQEDLWNQGTLRTVKRLMHLNKLLFLKQTHSDAGVFVASDTLEQLTAYKKEGDYLITQLESIGLGVYTADCLPIVFYDSCSHAIGICHAGWLGSVQGIAIKTVQAMQQRFGTRLEYLRVFFGPSAKVCCYQVTPEFSAQLNHLEYADRLLMYHGQELFFDLPLCNQLQLESYGVKKESFHSSYNICTICHISFCSYRRQGAEAARQLTIVALK
jgi:polyphenol oxidase